MLLNILSKEKTKNPLLRALHDHCNGGKGETSLQAKYPTVP